MNTEEQKIDKTEIFTFLTSNPVFHLATAEENKPRVRAMLLYRADENGIVFTTGKMKDLNKQLSKNKAVELCFNDYQKNIQIRINGSVELLEDLDLKKEIVRERDFLKPWIEQQGYEMLQVYRLKNGVATIWTMETNFAPKNYIELFKQS